MGVAFGSSMRGGIERVMMNCAPWAGGFQGIGTSIYPSLPQIYAVLSACRDIPQVKLATTPLPKVIVHAARSSTPDEWIRPVA